MHDSLSNPVPRNFFWVCMAHKCLPNAKCQTVSEGSKLSRGDPETRGLSRIVALQL